MALACLGAIFIGMLNARAIFLFRRAGRVNHIKHRHDRFGLAAGPADGQGTGRPGFTPWPSGVFGGGSGAGCFSASPTLRSEGFRYRWVSPWRDRDGARSGSQDDSQHDCGVAATSRSTSSSLQGLAFGENSRIVGQFDYAVRLVELPKRSLQPVAGDFSAAHLVGAGAGQEFCRPVPRQRCRQATGHILFINHCWPRCCCSRWRSRSS